MSSLVSGEPLRVLLVSPRAELREELGDALQGAGEHRFYWVSQPDLALTRAEGLAPHVILLDDDLGEGAGADEAAALVRRLVQALPESVVLLLIEPESFAHAQAAIFAGARAFIVKPVKGEELVPILRQALGHRFQIPQSASSEAHLGRVVVFCGSKGGTGRTTLALNTGISLHDVSREDVVIVDADYAAPVIDVALNLRSQRDIRDLLPKLNQLDNDLISSVLATHSSGVCVLLAPPPDALEYPPTLPQVQQVTASLKRMFPWVLVDLGLPLDEAAYAFLDAADRVIMSVLPELVGMRNARVMLAQFDARNYPPGKVWPLLNRDGLPGGVKKPDVAAYLGRDLAFAIPNDQELATETVNSGIPMVIAHRRRPVAQAYRKLATRLVEDRKPATQGAVVAVAAPIAVSARAPAAVIAGASAAERTVPPKGAAPATARTPAAAVVAPVSSLPRPTAEPARGKRWPVFIAGAVVLALAVLSLAGFVALQAAGNSRNSADARTLTPTSVQVAALVWTPTPSPTAPDQATRDAAATRVGETLARLFGPTPAETALSPGEDVDANGSGAIQGELAPTPSSTPNLPPPPTATPTDTPTPVPTPSATAEPSATPSATERPTLEPTDSPTPAEKATATPRASVRATATRRPTATATTAPTASATTVSASPPALAMPENGKQVRGVVRFAWVPTSPLPPGAAYEVVWWNVNESPDRARGLAAPTTENSLFADLSPLYYAGAFTNSQVFWSVLVVNVAPYVRLTSPSDGEMFSFYYSP